MTAVIKFLPIILIVLLFLGLVSNTKKTKHTISIVDQKILDFKSKNFTSLEEREVAKKQLIAELIQIKENFTSNHFSRGYFKMSDIIMTRISLL